jgi:hypothetical protein
MLRTIAVACLVCVPFSVCWAVESGGSDGWIPLFNGRSLDGWQASEREGTFTVQNGELVVHGDRSHLFYVGPVNHGVFKNFEFTADVKTTQGSNSGIYFHTAYEQTGWPRKGFECQVNTTHSDRKKTGGLYNVRDVMDNAPSKDGQWFNYYIRVEGKHVTIKINNKVTADWTEPDRWIPPRDAPGRSIDQGTFAIQGHDPKSLVYYKNIMVRPLDPIKVVVVTGGHDFDHDPFFTLFQGQPGIQYVEAVQKDSSELFEDISKWDYDVIVLYNMTQDISDVRKRNFKALLDRGVGLVALHHAEDAVGAVALAHAPLHAGVVGHHARQAGVVLLVHALEPERGRLVDVLVGRDDEVLARVSRAGGAGPAVVTRGFEPPQVRSVHRHGVHGRLPRVFGASPPPGLVY